MPDKRQDTVPAPWAWSAVALAVVCLLYDAAVLYPAVISTREVLADAAACGLIAGIFIAVARGVRFTCLSLAMVTIGIFIQAMTFVAHA